MSFESNQSFAKILLQIFYKDDPLKFLLDLKQISFKYFTLIFVTYSIIMSCGLKHNLKIKYLKEIERKKIYSFTT